MNSISKTVLLTGTYLRDTEKACQFHITEIDEVPVDDDIETNQWFPFSQVERIHHGAAPSPEGRDHGAAPGRDKMEVTRWILEQKGLV